MAKRKKYKSLNFNDRKVIEEKVAAGARPCEIAAAVGVHVATIYRELKRGTVGSKYNAEKAQCKILR